MAIARYASCLLEPLSPSPTVLRVAGGLGRRVVLSDLLSVAPVTGGSFVDSARVPGTSTERLLLRFSLPIRLSLAPPYATAASRFFRSATEDDPAGPADSLPSIGEDDVDAPNWDAFLSSPPFPMVDDNSRDGR